MNSSISYDKRKPEIIDIYCFSIVGYNPSFRNELVQAGDKQTKDKSQPENYHSSSAKERPNNIIISSSYPHPNFFLKWRNTSKYKYSNIIQKLWSNKIKNDIKLLHARRIKRACKLTMTGRRRRGLGEECFNGGKDIFSGGGVGSVSGGTGGEGVLSTTATTDTSSFPSTSKYFTTITSSSSSDLVTSSAVRTTNDNIALIPNEPIKTESYENGLATTITDQSTTLSARYSEPSTYFTTSSSTSFLSSATPRTRRSVRVTQNQRITRAISMQKQTSTKYSYSYIKYRKDIFETFSYSTIIKYFEYYYKTI